MKRMNKFVCMLFIGSMLITGCGSTSATDTQIQATQEKESVSEQAEESVSSSLVGMVESLDEYSITIAIMENTPQNDNMEKPDDIPNGDGDANRPDDMPNGDGGANRPDDMPNGDGGANRPDDMPNGDGSMQIPENHKTQTITLTDDTQITDENGNIIALTDLTTGAMVNIITDEDGNAISVSMTSMEMSMGKPDGNMDAPSSYDSVNTYTTDTDICDETYLSNGTDENAILVSEGAAVSLDSITINRTSKDSTGGDNASFYGTGAALLVTDGTLSMTDSNIETDADGAAGVFAYGNGIANVSDTTIQTYANTSGGIHVAGGGTLYASNLTVETDGESSAAIRSDRGGGTMTVNSGSYTANGLGSPAIYCTADITVSDADLTATGSEAVCIEGLNSLVLTDCNLSGSMKKQEQNDCTWNVILYQSMSGDSEIGNSTFSMTGGTLTANNGGMFYTTNTESTFYLSQVDITYADKNDFFLKCTGNSNQRGWGKSGDNGADCSFTADSQSMSGDVIWDSISTLSFEMQNNSILTGAFIQDESHSGNGGNGYANLTIDASSSWIVTGDSTLSSLICKGSITDTDGNSVTIKNTDGDTLFEGTSSYIITVSSFTS